MTRTTRLLIATFTALMIASVPALVLRQASARPRAPRPSPALRGYDPQMARACERSCALKLPYREADLAPQPEAPNGALTHCPVSGVVFRVRVDGPKAEAGGRRWHFCCATCARLFKENPGRFATLKSRRA